MKALFVYIRAISTEKMHKQIPARQQLGRVALCAGDIFHSIEVYRCLFYYLFFFAFALRFPFGTNQEENEKRINPRRVTHFAFMCSHPCMLLFVWYLLQCFVFFAVLSYQKASSSRKRRNMKHVTHQLRVWAVHRFVIDNCWNGRPTTPVRHGSFAPLNRRNTPG